MPPNSTAKGIIFWLMNGTRSKAISTTVPNPTASRAPVRRNSSTPSMMNTMPTRTAKTTAMLARN